MDHDAEVGVEEKEDCPSVRKLKCFRWKQLFLETTMRAAFEGIPELDL